MHPRDTVEIGYDRIAEQYLATKPAGEKIIVAQLERLAAGLPDEAAMLDLGCGAGVPALQRLAQRFRVTGVDISARQLELARQHVPHATLIKSDMLAVEFEPARFDAVVALHSIIHVPREQQGSLLGRILKWLKPGGGFLATWAIDEWEGQEADWEGWDAPMWWSHFGADDNLAMLIAAGFTIQSADRITQNDETWLWVLAHKPV